MVEPIQSLLRVGLGLGFLEMLKLYETYIIPCVDPCRKNMKEHLKEMPPDNHFGSAKELFYWTYRLHDMVNKTNGKESPPFSVVYNYYYLAAQGKVTMKMPSASLFGEVVSNEAVVFGAGVTLGALLYYGGRKIPLIGSFL